MCKNWAKNVDNCYSQAKLHQPTPYLKVDKNYFVVKEPIKYVNQEKGIELIALPDDHYNITSTIDYNSPVLGKQVAKLEDLKDFEKEISEKI